MSDEERRTGIIYFTRSRARVEEEIDPVNYDGEAGPSAEGQSDSFQASLVREEDWASQLVAQPWHPLQTPEYWVRGVAQLVGVAAVRSLASKKRL